jgi:fatty acid desaturase
LAPGQSWLGGAVSYFGKLFGGHALLSAAAPLAVALPETLTRMAIASASTAAELDWFRASALRAFTNPRRRARIHADLAAVTALIAAGAWCWGRFWPVLAACYAARYFMLSLLDNAHHYGTALDSGSVARNTWVPGWATPLLLNQNLHGIHHASPELDWRALRPRFEQSRAAYNGLWLACVLRQLRGPMTVDRLRPAAEKF